MTLNTIHQPDTASLPKRDLRIVHVPARGALVALVSGAADGTPCGHQLGDELLPERAWNPRIAPSPFPAADL